MSSSLLLVVALVAASSPVSAPSSGALSVSEEQAIALAIERSKELIAARLELETAQVERVAATLLANPELSYGLSNIVLPPANPQGVGLNPGPLDQTIHTLGISQVLDVWAKRHLRAEAADRGIEYATLKVKDALRDVTRAVRLAYAELVREQDEYALSTAARSRYDDTLRISRSRVEVGDISKTEFAKIELESLKYRSHELDAALQLDLARQNLGLLLLLSPGQSDGLVVASPGRREVPLDVEALVTQALKDRPDLAAVQRERSRALSVLAYARRQAYPDPTVGLTYTRDRFVVSGDNPQSLGLSVSIPVPLFERNQAGIGHAQVDLRGAENAEARLVAEVRHEVEAAVRTAVRSKERIKLFEGGMLERAETSLRIAERSYQAGAVSLLELLEAQRTFLDVKSQYLETVFEHQQATIDLAHAVGAT